MRIDGTLSQVDYQGISASKNVDAVEKVKEVKNFDNNTTALNETEKKEINEDELIQAIKDVNKSIKAYDRRLEYSVHEKTNTIMVKVIDTSDGNERVIREIPPEKILDMVAKMWELAGIIVDERV